MFFSDDYFMEDRCVREVKTSCWEKTQSSWKVGNEWLQEIDVRVVYVKLYRILHSPVIVVCSGTLVTFYGLRYALYALKYTLHALRYMLYALRYAYLIKNNMATAFVRRNT